MRCVKVQSRDALRHVASSELTSLRLQRSLALMTAPTIPVVLIHGFTGSPASWDSVVEGLNGVDLDLATWVSRVGLPGHGGRAAPSSLADSDAAIAAVIDAPALLVGYSLGGRLALHYALKHPAQVRGLLLFGARPGLPDDSARDARAEADRQLAIRLREDGLEAFADRWETLPLLRPRTASCAAITKTRAIRRSHDAPGLASALEVFSPGRLPDLWPRLGELIAPATWVAGTEDADYMSMMRRAASHCSRGDFESVPGAGHDVLTDSPVQVADLICKYVSRLIATG
ncbi:MAG: 2-succinyl-6-hydroxy-2,4-cyclohexadiene-1-carboxylate synthase [Myxococcota bacterium]|jgi:2-succinyl-6-hydroxy-2,4-cyclohexadiene-1-carboxylate synthase